MANNLKVLIIEDEKPLRTALKDHLTISGYRVIEAANGKLGLQLAEQEMPDLVILDIIMPVMNGVEFLNNLRDTAWGKKIKVIVLTNVDNDQKIFSQTAAADPCYFLIKSQNDLFEISEKVDEILAPTEQV